jgi:alpha-ketoglutarate-dependent taurine dioxygenase
MTLTDLSEIFDVEELAAGFSRKAAAPITLTARRPTRGEDIDPTLASTISAELHRRAAVLIHGLVPLDAPAVAALADLIFAGTPAFGTGEHPRAEGTEALYHPVQYAPEETLLWHHENTFNRTWPQSMLFACAVPADDGGETTIADSRLVHAAMPQDVIEAFTEHGVRYQRLCDGRAGRTWQQIYGTQDPDTAAAVAEANEEQLDFTGHGKARIRTVRPAFQPVPHGISWFNQVLHWHPHALPDELRVMVSQGLLPAFRDCALGNGDEIPPKVVDELIEAHRTIEYPIRWRAGDILLIDNLIVAHGRAPYRGRREHFVRMAGIGYPEPPRLRSESGSDPVPQARLRADPPKDEEERGR